MILFYKLIIFKKTLYKKALRAVSSVGRAIPFKEWVVGSSPTRLTTNYDDLIGGYSKVTSPIHSFIFLILFSADG